MDESSWPKVRAGDVAAGAAEKKSASGTPKQHRTSLSAATGEVLTRFARRHPSDLRHHEYNQTWRRWESLSVLCQVRAVHVHHVLPTAVRLFLEHFHEFPLVGYTRSTLGLGHGREPVVSHVVGQVSPAFDRV